MEPLRPIVIRVPYELLVSVLREAFPQIAALGTGAEFRGVLMERHADTDEVGILFRPATRNPASE